MYVIFCLKRGKPGNMRKLSKIICLIVLCAFTFTASAGSILRCCDMPDKTDTQQSPVGTTSKNCHTDQSQSSDESFNVCCQDMNLCNGSIAFVSNSSLVTVQMILQSVQLSQSEQLVFNISAPPMRPPKLIN